MLKNQEAEQPAQTPSSPTPSGAPRVTPAELNAALAAIESRKQAEASRLAGTIPIDQAISDLHLDSTSDEIWAEVQAQREKVSLPTVPVEQPQRAAPPLSVSLPVARVRPHGWRRLLAPILVIGVLMGAGVIPHSFTPQGFSPSLLTSKHFPTAAPILTPLSTVPDGKEVYADDYALAQISEGKPEAKITVSQNASGNRWTLMKRDGHVYLRGYIEQADNLQALAGKALNVYNDDNSGELHGDTTSNITVRVDDVPLQKSSGDGSFSGITLPNFQPAPSTTLTPGR